MSCPSTKGNKPMQARHLLDTISQGKHIATALEEIIDVYGDKLPKCAISHLTVLSKSAKLIHQKGRREVAKISPIPNLLKSYDVLVKHERRSEPPRPVNNRLSDSMLRATEYVKKFDKQNSTASSASKQSPSPVVTSVFKKPRRSLRSTVSPEKDDIVKLLMKGYPLNGGVWTKDTLCVAMSQLEEAVGKGKFKPCFN